MPIDKTDNAALNQLVQKYKDEIVGYEYKSWREAYLAPPPPKSFCQGMTRYRKCFKVTHIKLKDGSKIVVGGMFHGNNVGGNNYQDNDIGCGCLIVGIILILFLAIISR